MAKVWAFRCSWSGLYYPADYMKEWGRKYGLGLGPEPVSEALNSRYDVSPVVPDNGDVTHAMHPVEVVKAQLDLVQIEEEEYEANRAILAKDDPRLEQRSRVLRERQISKNGRLAGIVKGHNG